MSRIRQAELGVRTFGITTRQAAMIPPQSEDWAQLIYATNGSLTVEGAAGDRLWYVPAQRAIWLPAGSASRLHMRGLVRLRMVYVHRSLCRGLPGEERALNIEPLLHELILETVRRSVLPRNSPFTGVLLELLLKARGVSLFLRMPRDERARKVADMLLREPSRRSTLIQLGREAGAGVRTLERLFAAETGALVRGGSDYVF